MSTTTANRLQLNHGLGISLLGLQLSRHVRGARGGGGDAEDAEWAENADNAENAGNAEMTASSGALQ